MVFIETLPQKWVALSMKENIKDFETEIKSNINSQSDAKNNTKMIWYNQKTIQCYFCKFLPNEAYTDTYNAKLEFD